MIKNDIKNIKIHPHNHFRKYKKFDSEFTEYVYFYYSVKYGSFTSTNYEFMNSCSCIYYLIAICM